MKVDHHTKSNHINTRLLIAIWGLGLILIGGLSLIPGDQTDLAMLGLGILLLGLNLARYLNHIQVSYFSITHRRDLARCGSLAFAPSRK